MTVDDALFRRALGRFASGICVVTARDGDGTPVGVTISSFASLSLRPPLVLYCLGKLSSHFEAFMDDTHFGVSVLAEDQGAVADIFAGQGADKFDRVVTRAGDNGCRLVDGSVLQIECDVVDCHDGGDHVIIVGQVQEVSFGTATRPLGWYASRYVHLADIAL